MKVKTVYLLDGYEGPQMVRRGSSRNLFSTLIGPVTIPGVLMSSRERATLQR
jgi:hypothetical protein